MAYVIGEKDFARGFISSFAVLICCVCVNVAGK